MSIPLILKKIKNDPKDEKFNTLKGIFLNELKKKIDCENHEVIIKYIFEIVCNPSLDKATFDKEFKELFEEKSTEFQDLLIKSAQLVYTNEEEEDLLDEVNKGKSNDNSIKREVKGKEFNLGGKKVVLKSKKYDDNEVPEDEQKRERSRDKSREYKESHHPSHPFHVPRGVLRGSYYGYPPFIRMGQRPRLE